MVVNDAMTHDDRRTFDEPDIRPLRVPLRDRLFVGQVHRFNDAGEEYLAY
jgi:hypothetical protein